MWGMDVDYLICLILLNIKYNKKFEKNYKKYKVKLWNEIRNLKYRNCIWY